VTTIGDLFLRERFGGTDAVEAHLRAAVAVRVAERTAGRRSTARTHRRVPRAHVLEAHRRPAM